MDIPSPALLVVEHQAEQKQCLRCHHIGLAPFPQEVRAPVQYGTRSGAIAVCLMQQQLLPLAWTAEVMEDLLGVSMSEGTTLCTLIARCARHLELVEERLKAALSQAQVIHQDETGMYVAGKRKRHWKPSGSCLDTLASRSMRDGVRTSGRA